MGGSYSFLNSFHREGPQNSYNDIMMFQQHHGESLSKAWTRFKDLLQKVPHHGIDLWLQVQIFYDHVNPVTRQTIDQSAGGKLRDLNAEESWALLEDLALYDNESWNDPRDFAKMVKAIVLPQDVPMNKIITSCEVCSGPYDTHNCMEVLEQAFVEYASSRIDEAGEGLVSEFMASQDARLSKFETDFKQQQSEMTNKIDIVLKAITNRIAGTLPSDTVKNPKLGTTPVLSACSYPIKDPQCSTHIHSSINTLIIHPKQPKESQDNEPGVGQEEKGNLGNINSNPHSQPDPLASITTEQIIQDDDEPQNESPNEGERTTTEGPTIEYFDMFPTRDELTYHNKEDKRRGVDYVMSKILGFYKECLELGPEYVTGLEDEGEVT
ncbi:hypothetical protein Tco_0498670 [Tanacetum coccineum]